MNIYIKDCDTKHCYAHVRSVDGDFRDIVHKLLCQTGCIETCVSDFWRSAAYTIYVNSVCDNMDDYIRGVVDDARALYKRLCLGVK